MVRPVGKSGFVKYKITIFPPVVEGEFEDQQRGRARVPHVGPVLGHDGVGDPVVVEEACTSDGEALQYVSPRLGWSAKQEPGTPAAHRTVRVNGTDVPCPDMPCTGAIRQAAHTDGMDEFRLPPPGADLTTE